MGYQSRLEIWKLINLCSKFTSQWTVLLRTAPTYLLSLGFFTGTFKIQAKDFDKN